MKRFLVLHLLDNLPGTAAGFPETNEMSFGGSRDSGGRSLRNFEYRLTSLSRTLPQSASLTAPSRREPFPAISSAYINKSSHKPFDWSVGTFCCCAFSVKDNGEKSSCLFYLFAHLTPKTNFVTESYFSSGDRVH